jgi:regulator-associated protein of mTOR
VKDAGHHYFIKHLEDSEPGISSDSRAQAAFVLAIICDGYPRGRLLCAEQGLLAKLLSLLAALVCQPPLLSLHASSVLIYEEVLLSRHTKRRLLAAAV